VYKVIGFLFHFHLTRSWAESQKWFINVFSIASTRERKRSWQATEHGQINAYQPITKTTYRAVTRASRDENKGAISTRVATIFKL